MHRRNHPITLEQASQEAPTLAKLVELVRDSSARLRAVQELIPAPLLPAIKAGPIDGATWCLLADNAAAAAKLKQLAPALLAHLRSRGWQVTSIRLKVQTSSSR